MYEFIIVVCKCIVLMFYEDYALFLLMTIVCLLSVLARYINIIILSYSQLIKQSKSDLMVC